MALAVLEMLCFTAFLLYVRAALKDKEQVPFYRVPGLLPLTMILLFMLVQVLPLPSGLVRIISPAAYDMYARTLGVSRPLGFITLSVDVKSTVHEFFRFAAYGAFYILTIQLLSDGKRLKRTVMTLAWLGACIASYALVERFFKRENLLAFFHSRRKQPCGALRIQEPLCRVHGNDIPRCVRRFSLLPAAFQLQQLT